MGRLLLIRHGESEGNRERSFTRTPDVPLTESGREQVRAAAEWIAARYRPLRIVTSPFARARQTADILSARLALPVLIEPELRERSYGTLAGQPYAAARSSPGWSPDEYWLWRPPGGENLLEVTARAGAVLDRVARRAPDDDVVVVSHGAVMMALWRHVTGAWSTGRVSRNAGIVVVEHAGDRYLSATAIEDG
jgi:probable phosphoglycerate mutase